MQKYVRKLHIISLSYALFLYLMEFILIEANAIIKNGTYIIFILSPPASDSSCVLPC